MLSLNSAASWHHSKGSSSVCSISERTIKNQALNGSTYGYTGMKSATWVGSIGRVARDTASRMLVLAARPQIPG